MQYDQSSKANSSPISTDPKNSLPDLSTNSNITSTSATTIQATQSSTPTNNPSYKVCSATISSRKKLDNKS